MNSTSTPWFGFYKFHRSDFYLIFGPKTIIHPVRFLPTTFSLFLLTLNFLPFIHCFPFLSFLNFVLFFLPPIAVADSYILRVRVFAYV